MSTTTTVQWANGKQTDEPVIGTVTLTEPLIHTISYETAAWWTEVEIAPGTYSVILLEPNTFYARPGLRVTGTIVRAYLPSLYGGVSVGSQPQHENHSSVGQRSTVSCSLKGLDIDFDPTVVEYEASMYLDTDRENGGGLVWKEPTMKLRHKSTPLLQTDRHFYRLLGAGLNGLDIVTTSQQVLLTFATPDMHIEEGRTDSDRVSLYYQHRGDDLLRLIVAGRSHYSPPTLAEWAEAGVTAEMLDRYGLRARETYDRSR